MKSRVLLDVAIAFFVSNALLGFSRVEAMTIVVPDDEATIQGALNRVPWSYSSDPLDTVLVRSGVYSERVRVLDRVVLRGEPGSNGAGPPEISELLVTDWSGHGPMIVESLHVSGRTRIAIGGTPLDILFNGCRLDSGLVDVAGASEGWRLRLVRCAIRGGAFLGPVSLHVDSSTIEGSLVFASGKSTLALSHSELEGEGAVGIEAEGSDNDITLTGNALRGFSMGISVRDAHRFSMRGNRIEGCADAAASIDAIGDVTIENNEVRRCGAGLVAKGLSIRIDRNRVVDCAGSGLWLWGMDAVSVENNVIGRCGDGVSVGRAMGLLMRGNTLYDNRGAGARLGYFEGGIVSQNVGYRNNGPAMDPGFDPTSESEILQLSCNDWFENGGGDGGGPTDFSIDPVFCAIDSDDVHLRSDSPLLNAGACGFIGALGLGCTDSVTTPVLVQRFDAERVPEGVLVRWRIADVAWTEAPIVQRAPSEGGPWRGVPVLTSAPDGTVTALDRGVSADQVAWYRLACCGRSSDRVLAGPIEVPAGARPGFRLIRVGPSPSAGPVGIEFDLPRSAPIAIEVFDLGGRRVTTLASGAWSIGTHSIRWTGDRDGSTPHPGVYLIRFRHPEGTQTERVVIAR